MCQNYVMPLFTFIERTEPTTLPEDSEVMIGERANFTCNAFGSFIAIFWRFNNSLLNCNESGCDNRAAFVQERNISYSDVNGNTTIESTLEINTEGFPLRNFVIACIITQDEPEYVQGAGTPDGIFSSLLMLRNEGIFFSCGYKACLIIILSYVLYRCSYRNVHRTKLHHTKLCPSKLWLSPWNNHYSFDHSIVVM